MDNEQSQDSDECPEPKPKSDQPQKLTLKQELFVLEYLVDRNGTRAYMRAFKTKNEDTARTEASKLLANPIIRQKVDAAVKERSKRTEITADTVLRELLKLATVDVTQAFDEAGWLKQLKDIPEDVRRSIAGMEVQELFQGEGDDRSIIGVTRKVKFYDKIKPLELLGKHLKLFADRIEHSGPDGKPIEHKTLSDIPDAQLDAKIAAILAKESEK